MMDETIPEVTATVCVGGQELDTDAFTSLVCVQPTKIWRQKHERIKVTHPYRNKIEWIYELSGQRHGSLGEAIDEVLSVFWGKKDVIKQFIKANGLSMHVDCRPFGDASVIEYVLRPEVLGKLAFFEATLSLGIYKDEIKANTDS